MSVPDEYVNMLLQMSVAKICQTLGFQTSGSIPLEMLMDICRRFISQMCQDLREYGDHFGRCDSILDDFGMVMEGRSIALSELADYITQSTPSTSSHKVPLFPVKKSSGNLCCFSTSSDGDGIDRLLPLSSTDSTSTDAPQLDSLSDIQQSEDNPEHNATSSLKTRRQHSKTSTDRKFWSCSGMPDFSNFDAFKAGLVAVVPPPAPPPLPPPLPQPAKTKFPRVSPLPCRPPSAAKSSKITSLQDKSVKQLSSSQSVPVVVPIICKAQTDSGSKKKPVLGTDSTSIVPVVGEDNKKSDRAIKFSKTQSKTHVKHIQKSKKKPIAKPTVVQPDISPVTVKDKKAKTDISNLSNAMRDMKDLVVRLSSIDDEPEMLTSAVSCAIPSAVPEIMIAAAPINKNGLFTDSSQEISLDEKRLQGLKETLKHSRKVLTKDVIKDRIKKRAADKLKKKKSIDEHVKLLQPVVTKTADPKTNQLLFQKPPVPVLTLKVPAPVVVNDTVCKDDDFSTQISSSSNMLIPPSRKKASSKILKIKLKIPKKDSEFKKSKDDSKNQKVKETKNQSARDSKDKNQCVTPLKIKPLKDGILFKKPKSERKKKDKVKEKQNCPEATNYLKRPVSSDVHSSIELPKPQKLPRLVLKLPPVVKSSAEINGVDDEQVRTSQNDVVSLQMNSVISEINKTESPKVSPLRLTLRKPAVHSPISANEASPHQPIINNNSSIEEGPMELSNTFEAAFNFVMETNAEQFDIPIGTPPPKSPSLHSKSPSVINDHSSALSPVPRTPSPRSLTPASPLPAEISVSGTILENGSEDLIKTPSGSNTFTSPSVAPQSSSPAPPARPASEASTAKSESDDSHIWVCPSCGVAYDEDADMIACDNCDNWYHWSCVGLLKAPPENQEWFCTVCAAKKAPSAAAPAARGRKRAAPAKRGRKKR